MPTVLGRLISKAMPYALAEFNHGRRSTSAATVAPAAAIPHEGHRIPRLGAHANAVSVVGLSTSGTRPSTNSRENAEGYWYIDVPEAKSATSIATPSRRRRRMSRIDPMREVTNSVGNGVVHDRNFTWGEEYYKTPPWNEWVIYEASRRHFQRWKPDDPKPAQFDSVVRRFDHLKLGVNCIKSCRLRSSRATARGDTTRARLRGRERYGGPKEVQGIHSRATAMASRSCSTWSQPLRPSDLDCGARWMEPERRRRHLLLRGLADTPWGSTRPDYGRPEVRQFIRDNALMWIEDYHIDGSAWI